MKKQLLFIIGALSFLAAASPSYGLTSGEIINRARIYLKDDSSVSNRQQFSTTTLFGFLNDGQREFAANTWILETQQEITISSGVSSYALNENLAGVTTVLRKDTKTTLHQTTQRKLDAEVYRWRSSSGTPTEYYLSFTTTTRIAFYPLQNESFLIGVFYAQLPNPVLTTTDVPFNGYPGTEPYHTALIYYLVCRGYQVLEESELADPFCTEWKNIVRSAKVGPTGLMFRPDFYPETTGLPK